MLMAGRGGGGEGWKQRRMLSRIRLRKLDKNKHKQIKHILNAKPEVLLKDVVSHIVNENIKKNEGLNDVQRHGG